MVCQKSNMCMDIIKQRLRSDSLTQKSSHLRVLVEIATIPSGHCSDENPAAYSRVS